MIESKDLELTSTLTMGTLNTNAAYIRDFVAKQLENYKPELYIGKADEAKKDRAELNKAADKLNDKRKELEREFNKPFAEFKAIVDGAVKNIKAASSQLDAIVKTEESREKNEKRAEIEKIWSEQQFDLVPLEKIFNEKWLNKTTKLSTVADDIKAIIAGIMADLSVIDNFDKNDVPLVKSVYLEKLSLSEAAQYAETLKANREKLANEQAQKQQQAINAQLEQQHADERDDRRSAEVDDAVNAATAAAMMTAPEQAPIARLESYAVIFTGTRDKLIRLREYMTAQGITYQKLADNKDGTFTL